VVFNPREPLSVAHKDAMIRDSVRPGLTVVALGSESADGVPDAVGRLLNEKVDAIGLVAGLGPACSRVIEQSTQAKVPVFGFRESHDRDGALAAEVPDVERVGLEAGRITSHVLNGEGLGDRSPRPLIDTTTFVNTKTADALAITLPPGALRNARTVGAATPAQAP
jgi:ABC-type uncharacterized transport system substrate-binding protein